jgi:hypothetical protein
MPAAGEALLLGCCHDLTVLDEAGSRVMVKGRNAEDAHVLIPD